MGEHEVLHDADTGGRRFGEVTGGTGSSRDGWCELLDAFGASDEPCFAITDGVQYWALGGFVGWGDAVLCIAGRSVGVFQVYSVDGLQAYL